MSDSMPLERIIYIYSFSLMWFSIVLALLKVAMPPNLGPRDIYRPDSITRATRHGDPEGPKRSHSVYSGESSAREGAEFYASGDALIASNTDLEDKSDADEDL